MHHEIASMEKPTSTWNLKLHDIYPCDEIEANPHWRPWMVNSELELKLDGEATPRGASNILMFLNTLFQVIADLISTQKVLANVCCDGFISSNTNLQEHRNKINQRNEDDKLIEWIQATVT